MKLKATVSEVLTHCSKEHRYALARLVITLNAPALAQRVMDEVLVKHLQVPSRNSEGAWGPAEYFDQETDRMIPWDSTNIGVDVTLSGVSFTARRAVMNFWNATSALANVYRETIESSLLVDQRAQLLVRMALDKPVEYLDRPGTTTLLEEGPVWIEGKVQSDIALTPEVVLTAELQARLGIPTTELLLSVLRESGGIRLPLSTLP